ncbi:hypothetical protein ACER0C_006882 [Sarotherodon galilaeus]
MAEFALSSRMIGGDDGNRTVCVLREEQLCPDDPERLKQQQLVCRDALTGPCYWEVERRASSSSD